MAYIGKEPAKAPLTSSDVADGIISNAKLAQDIISADTALGAEPADTDEFLVSDAGTLKRMDYSHIKGGGSWVKILQQTASTSSSIEFKHGTSGVVIDSTYRAYCIVYTDCYASTQHTISVQVSPDTGSSYDTSGYYWVRHTVNYNGGSQSVTNATGTGELMLLNQHGASLTTGGNGIIYLFSPSNASSKTTGISYALECSDGSNYIRHQQVVGIHDTAEAIDAFRILPSTGTINGGVFTLYGLTP